MIYFALPKSIRYFLCRFMVHSNGGHEPWILIPNMLNIVGKIFAVVSGVCSIVGVVSMFLLDKDRFLVAVIVYSIAITAFFIAVYIHVLRSLSFRYKDKYKRIAVLNTFTCDDGKTVVFETRKFIQSKAPFLNEVTYERKWQGRGMPIFKVNGHPVNYSTNGNPDEFDKVSIKLDKTLAYNETSFYTTSHECQYSEYEPRFGCKVDEPTDFIQFRILLGSKNGKQKPAKLYKRSLKSGGVSTDQLIKSIDFDQKHKLYFYVIEHPEIGYNYFIVWDK